MRPLDWEDFLKTTKQIWQDKLLRPYGIASCGTHGQFEPDRFEELLQFCKENPEFHVVSSVKDRDLNYAVPDALFYRLALGNKDPFICYLCPLHYKIC